MDNKTFYKVAFPSKYIPIAKTQRSEYSRNVKWAIFDPFSFSKYGKMQYVALFLHINILGSNLAFSHCGNCELSRASVIYNTMYCNGMSEKCCAWDGLVFFLNLQPSMECRNARLPHSVKSKETKQNGVLRSE